MDPGQRGDSGEVMVTRTNQSGGRTWVRGAGRDDDRGGERTGEGP